MLGKLEIDSQGTIIAKAQATAGTSGIYAYDGIVIKMVILQHMLQKQLTVAVVLNVMAI